MVATEQYFPRGGKKPQVGVNKKKYDFLGNSDKIGKKKKYRPKILHKNVEEDLEYFSDTSYDDNVQSIKALSAEKLSHKTLQEGMVLLGRISNITDTKVTITLPSRLYGYVMASHVSLPYTKLLKSYVDDEIESITSLDELFKIGEYVSVKVISLTSIDDKIIPAFSMMPQDVNLGMSFSSMQEGDIIRGAIESSEDHGYVLDLGIPNCRTFLPSKWVEKSLTLNVGQVIWCTIKKFVKSLNNSIITVTNKLNIINSSCLNTEKALNYSISDLKPGMAVDFYVNKPLNDGAEGYVLSNCVGYIHTSQIVNRLLIGKKVKAYLLYIMPMTKLPFFTAREIFQTFSPNMDEEMPYKKGQIVEIAKVSKTTPNFIIFRVEKIVFIMPKKLSQHKEEENFTEYYATGSEHTLRIINYSMSDYAYLCSDQENMLNQKYFSFHDFYIGDLVEGVIKTVSEKGILVDINSLKGWIPHLHMTDVGLNWLSQSGSKNTNVKLKKFKTGEKILTRVLKVDPAKCQLHLTAKPTFLAAELEILQSFEDAKVGHQYKGMVETVFKHGILVTFFNGVCAFIHISELSHEKVKNIQEVVNIGQIVNCTVMSVNLNEKKMICSLIYSNNRNITKEINLSTEKKENEKLKLINIKDANDNNKFKNTILEISQSKSNDKKRKAKNIEASEMNCSIDELDGDVKPKKKKKKEKQEMITVKKLTEEISSSTKPIKKNQNCDKSLPYISDSTVTETEKSNIFISEKTVKNQSVKGKNKTSNPKETIASPITESVHNKINLLDNSMKNDIKSEKTFSSMINFWELNASTISQNINKNMLDSSSSDSEEEVEEKSIKKKKKRLTNAEKVQKARDDEEKLRQIEKELMEVDSQPKSSDHFDRLLLANPNSSELWIAYMAFHLQATEIDRARAIAKKAINIISFREENEKMNVWLALLNLENRFGTKESLGSTLKDAIQMNDSFKIHSKMLDMYVETGKINELTSLVDTMLAKYKNNPDVYMSCGEACYKLALVVKARAVMQKAISRLDNKKHVSVLIKFAQLENSNGDSERAETLFEQLLGCMPQRVDICCIYIDMLLKSEKIDNARFVLERAVSQKLNTRKMKLLYKKWIELEEKYGDNSKIEKVKQMALEFIEKATN